MEIVNKQLIERDVLKGYYMFLKSRTIAHEQEITSIRQEMRKISRQLKLTPEEKVLLLREAEKFHNW